MKRGYDGGGGWIMEGGARQNQDEISKTVAYCFLFLKFVFYLHLAHLYVNSIK